MERRSFLAEVQININKVMRRGPAVVNVHLTGVKEFRLRMKMATWLIRLAAIVAGPGIFSIEE